jgi:hypothetical protein
MERRGEEGKRAGGDAHLHAKLRQWVRATERRQSCKTAALSSLAAKAAAWARAAR